MEKDLRRELGQRAESLACEYLVRHGLTIVCRNYESKLNEVDIVAGKGDLLVFVEVRSSSSQYLETPAQTVVAEKQRRVVEAARWYLAERDAGECDVRFDVVAVIFFGQGHRVEWYQDAFRPPPSGQKRRYQW